MKKVLGVSLGSSTRDHKVVIEVLGEKVEIERRGTDGDVKKMMQIFQEYDGKVDIFSLGGTDLYLYSGPQGKRYTIRESEKIISIIKKTPIVDGTGIKYVLEKSVVKYIDTKIAGDYLGISQYMPEDMGGKTIITNTVTSSNVEDLKKRGVNYLITTTPEFEGRSFGTNVFQATLVAISGKSPEELQSEDYLKLIEKTGFKPRIEKLN
jgi:hypothetical protein